MHSDVGFEVPETKDMVLIQPNRNRANVKVYEFKADVHYEILLCYDSETSD